MRHATNDYNLSTEHPDLAKEWHPTKNGDLKSTDVTPGSDEKVWWLCKKVEGHEWEAAIKSRSRGSGCPECYNRKRILNLLRITQA